MRWNELLAVIKNPVIETKPTRDKSEAFKAIEDGMARSEKEAQSSSNEAGRVATIGLLFEKAPELLKSGYHFIGFEGGLSALANSDLATLKNRGHYKYADRQHGTNWIPLVRVVNRYLELEELEHRKQTI
ncbi:hypothetical protein CLU86_1238 [Acidovorax sp. 62]|uniref:hypothetical protein n=1 Tax=Acidovorax sp. 62 TaxID=2035203 RepID=UPI000C18CB90|nr:hypothetical protein [Acidovorax sp. 62]PIF90354.1 hypothetical protein CLU86_1238 [Acidovorax sp. 62]